MKRTNGLKTITIVALATFIATPALLAAHFDTSAAPAGVFRDVMIADSWVSSLGNNWAATYLNLTEGDQDDITHLAQLGDLKVEMLVSGTPGTRFKVQFLREGEDENANVGAGDAVYEIKKESVGRFIVDLPDLGSMPLRRIVIHSGALVFGEDLGNGGASRPVGVLFVRFFPARSPGAKGKLVTMHRTREVDQTTRHR